MKQPYLLIQQILLIIASFLLIGFVFLLFYHPIDAFTQDLGRHLKLGEIILKQKSIPSTNLFSYTFPNQSFFNHHWLSQVIFYSISQISLHLLLILTSAIAALSFGIVYFYSVKKYLPISSLIIGIFTVFIMSERIALRPEIFSFLFASVFLVILFIYREKNNIYIYLLPLLSLVWIQLHIYFFVGLILIALFLIEQVFFYFFTKNGSKIKTLLVVLVLSMCISVLNPQGISGLIYPLTVFGNYGYAIEENQTIFFLESLGINKSSAFYFKLFSLVGFIVLLVNINRFRLIDWLLFIVFIFSGFIAVRNLPIAALVLFIPLTHNLSGVIQKIFNSFKISKDNISYLNLIVFGFVILLLSFKIYGLNKENTIGYKVPTGAKNAADFYINNRIKGPVFNNFDIGSYLIYRLYPDQRVFIDGRPEAYPKEFFSGTYIPMQEDQNLFNQKSKNYKFNSIFFSHTDQTPWAVKFLKSIIKNPEWTTIYLDETIIILVKNNEENKNLIKKYNASNFKYKINDPSLRSYLQLASFYSKTEELEKELEVYQKILVLDPNNCIALRNSTIVSEYLNNNLAPLFAARYQTSCN